VQSEKDWIGVVTANIDAFIGQILSQETPSERFANTPFALQKTVSGTHC
jgi:hypothetical protein